MEQEETQRHHLGLQQSSHKKKKNKIKEIIIIGLLLIVILVILNFFKIVKLSELFPDQLSFLPRIDQLEEKFVPNEEEVREAREAFQDILPSVISDSNLTNSENIEVFQSSFDNNDFIIIQNSQVSNMTARIKLSPGGNEPIQLNILYYHNTNEDISANYADQIVPEYFKVSPRDDFSCGVLTDAGNYCESFWEEDDGTKIGVGIQEASTPNISSNSVGVFYCMFTPESDKNSWQSCTPEFSDTGV